MTFDFLDNKFKQAMRRPGAQIGLWLGTTDPGIAEACAGAGFDWLLIDGEHAPNDVRTILDQLRAVAPHPAHPVVRPVQGDPALIKQLLDVGANTLLVPMVDTVEQAAHLVRATRYPPDGFRGVTSGLSRASRYGRAPDYLKRANDAICLMLQIETLTGMANLEGIAALEGVDGIFIGPADLSAAMGHLGNQGHPDVQAAIERAIAVVLAAGKAPGILTPDEKLAQRYIGLGARFVAVGTDMGLLTRYSQELARRFKAG